MDVLQIYNSFKELSPSAIRICLDEELGLYDECIEPLNNELVQDLENVHEIERISILFRLIIWDKLFYNKYGYDEKKLLGQYKRKPFIDALLPIIHNQEKYSNSYKTLIDIFGRWPQIRDYIFKKQKSELDKCVTLQDFLSFIEKKPYLEYLLFARYRISQLNNTSFNEARVAIEKFPHSDILPISQLKALFQEVNGVRFLWKGNAFESDNETEMKEVVIDLISKCKPSNISNGCFLHSQPINYYLLRKILQQRKVTDKLLNYELYLHDCQKKEGGDESVIISSKDFFLSLISVLNDMVSGVKFSLPIVSMISVEQSTSLEYIWVNSSDKSGKQIVVSCRDGKIFPLSGGVFAGCLLMLDTQCY